MMLSSGLLALLLALPEAAAATAAAGGGGGSNSGGPPRVRLTCSTTYYIDYQGSDSSSCTVSAPCLTLEHTLRMIQDTVDFAGHLVTVACADGPAGYMGALNLAGSFVTGGGRLSIVGNTQAPERVFINATDSAAVGIVGDISIHLAGIKVRTSGGGVAIGAYDGARVYLDGRVEFAGSADANMLAHGPGSTIIVNSNYTISGERSAYHWVAEYGGAGVFDQDHSIDIVGVPFFEQQFALADGLGIIYCARNTYIGRARGIRYAATKGGIINTIGEDAVYLPGDVAGIVNTGGGYF